ncbi:MAG TPA: gliding motility-associated C-terminal domain-containing protein [Saprospiraceae bacterium]|nr:gliding motility-associated C-terminal domain-containing protein [Saprospiraceae bacterium]
MPSKSQSQCTNPSIALPDTAVPVTGNPAQAYCVTLTFDPSETGLPTGMSMMMEHSWQGDLTIFLTACGEVLNVMQRPGVIGSCAGGCPCGNTNDIGTPSGLVPLTFCDGCGPDPENGIPIGGGTFGVTTDDACGIGTVNSFAALWASCPPGPISTEVCVSDHAGADDGFVQNLTLLFPNPSVCGCTDPTAINYNSNATVDDGSCEYCMLTVTPNEPFVSVCSGNATNIGVSVMNNISPPIYSWSSPDGGLGFLSSTTVANPNVNIPPGMTGTFTYDVMVTSGPCVEFATITVSIDPPPFVEITGNDQFCQGGNTILTATSGYSNYSWSSGNSSSVITVNQPGNYILTVTDANGCSNTASFAVTQIPNPVPNITGPATICAGGSGTLDAGPGYDSYIWSNSATTQTIDVFASGIYFVTVTQDGCQGVDFFQITVGGSPSVSINGVNNLCANQTGTLTASAGFASYQWSTSANTQSITINGPGTYSVTVSDGNSCTATASFTVSQSPPLNPSISGDLTVCTGSPASLTVNGAFTSVMWSTSQTSTTITPSTPGTYSVTVMDAAGCSGTASATVSSAPDPVPTISGILEFCPGGSTQLTASGGFSSYMWSTSSNSQSIQVGSAGTYTVSVVDANGCQGQASVSVSQSQLPTPSITGNNQICAGGSTTLSVIGSFSSYLWSNSSTLPSITVSAPGTYSVTVTNAQGCQGTASYVVTQAPNPTPSITGITAICGGSSTVLNAGPGYTNYQWSPSGSGQSITVSTPGLYSVTVTDANGCMGSASVNVTLNPNPTPSITGDNSICVGESANLQATPGYASYQWSNFASGSNTTVFSGGTYFVTVADANGCTGTASFTVTQLSNPVPSISGATQFCEGSSTVLTAGPGYSSYQWSNSSNTMQTTALFGDYYEVTVTDANGCMGSAGVNVVELPTPQPFIDAPGGICPGGSADLNAGGGFASYVWSNNMQGQVITVGVAGVYEVTVTDFSGCQGESFFFLDQFDEPQPFIDGEPSICDGQEVLLIAESGYDAYNWSVGLNDQLLEVTAPGDYEVTVTDFNGCQGVASFTVGAGPSPTVNITGTTSICAGETTTLNAGTGFSSYLWSNSLTTSSITVSTAGTYTVTVTNSAGCQGSASATVTVATALNPVISGQLAYCEGGSTTLNAEPGYASYLWTGGSIGESLSVTAPGTYSVTVTSASGCSGVSAVQVVENPLPAVNITGDLDYCEGSSTTLFCTFGLAGYSWTTGSTAASIDVNNPGVAGVTVTDANGCQNEAFVTVSENANPIVNITGATSLCAGEVTTLNAGAGFNNYSWSTTSNNSSIQVSAAGNYAVTVTDANGCQGSDAVAVSVATALSPVISGTLAYCEGGATTLNADTGYATYLWSDSSDGESITVTAPGSYGLTVTSSSGCSGETSVQVTENPLPVVAISGDLDYCEGTSTTLMATAGYTNYAWTDGSMGATLVVNNPGNTGVTVTDANGCQNTTTVAVTENPNPDAEIMGLTEICEGEVSTLSAGTGFSSYNWSTTATGSSINVSTSGNYSVTVTDSNGCQDSDAVDFTVVADLSPVISGQLSFCEGSSTILTAETGYATYLWSDSSDGESLTVTTPGTYSLTVTSASGCSGETAVTVLENQLPTVNITGPDEYCEGESPTLTASSGFSNYMWNTTATNNSINVSNPGVYSVTATDSNGCQDDAQLSITENPMPNVNIAGALDYCEGDNTVLNAGAGFSTYTWTGGTSSPTLTVSTPGSYSVTVTDANGCEAEDQVTVLENALPEPVITGQTSICDGFTSTLDAGSGYANYAWSNSANGQSIDVTIGGTYAVTVIDGNGCTGATTIAVTVNNNPNINIMGLDQICPGGSTTLNAGAGFTTYDWSTTDNTPTINVSTPGSYSVTVVDANGCQGEAMLLVEETNELTPDITGATALCDGDAAVLDAGAGYATYLWSDSSDGQTLMVATPGDYSVTVTDPSGCFGSTTVTVEEAPSPVPVITGNDFCPGASTTLNAGSGYASYNWSTTQTGQNITVNTASTYTVTVTDDNGCTGEAALTVSLLPVPSPSISGILDICPEDGTVLDAGSGFASYQWNNSTMDQTLDVDAAGLYTVTVTNNEGCSASASATVSEFDSPVVPAGLSVEFCAGTTAVLNIGGGFADYEWETGDTTATTIVALPGNFAVTVSDANGCEGTGSVEAIENDLPLFTFGGETDFCFGTSTTIGVNESFVSYEWNTSEDTPSITVSSAGDYSVVVTDNNGCQNTQTIAIVENPLPDVMILGSLGFCTDGSTVLSASDTFVSYTWSNSSNEASIAVDVPGIYTLTVEDNNGCANSASVETIEVSELSPEIIGTPEYCAGSSTTLQVIGAFDTYNWSNDLNTAIITVNQPGIYTVTVTDITGCEGVAMMEVIENPLPAVAVDGLLAFCEGNSTTITATSGFVSYEWSNSAVTESVIFDEGGSYSVLVTDANGCQEQVAFELEELALPTPAIIGALNYCPGTSTTLTVSGNYDTYEWSNSETNNQIEVDQIGNYSILVTDANGCQGSAAVDVAEFATDDPEIIGQLNFCPGSSTQLMAEAGFEDYEWSTSQTQPMITVNTSGTYALTVTDANGCETFAAATVDEFAVSIPQISGITEFCEGGNSVLEAETGFASYFWSTSDNVEQITVDQSGTYAVTVTDGNGCETENSIAITENPNPVVVIGGSSSFCPGGFTLLNAGATYISYQWSDNTNGETLQVDVPGIYGLTVTDNEGCMGSASLEVIQDDELNPVISGELAYCPGGSTVLNAGSGFATYAWSDNSTNSTLMVNAPGNYSVTVTDQSGCVGDTTVAVAEFAPPQPFIIGIAEFCDGASSDLSVGGGTFMAFDWSTGSIMPSITINDGGSYSVLVTDENGCQETASIAVTENPLPVFSIVGDTEFCQGDQTTLMASGVFTAYEWSTGDTDQQTTTNLTGQITLEVTNEFGCSSENSVVLDEIPLPIADAGGDGVINCYNEATVVGGTGSSQGSQFEYTWSGPGIDANNMNEQFPEVNVAGTYLLTVLNTDYNCLSQEAEVFVADNTDEPVVVLEVLDILDCTTSTVVIDGTGSETGTGVVYEWFDGNMNPIANADSPILQASSADTYTLLVSDTLSGCTALESVEVQEDIAYPFAEAGMPQHLDCEILEVTLNNQGSTFGPDITFIWTDANGGFIGVDSAVQVTEPGWYFLQVSDEVNNCSNMDSVLVTQDIAVPVANAGQDQELNCLITAIALNGTGSTLGSGISYSWAYGNLDNIVGQGLNYQAEEVGTYYLIVYDAENDCSDTDAVLVTEDETQPSDLLLAIDDPTCFGDTDGSIILQNVVGGTPPYQYSFNGQPYGNNTAFLNLGAGTYTIDVLDAMGCEFELEAFIEDGNDLYLELGDDIPISLGESATIIAQVNIGEDEISSLNWKFIDSLDCEICLSVTVSPLQTTQYFVDLVDENGCTISDDITVFVDKRKSIFVPNIFSPNGDGANDVFMIQSGPDVVKINEFQVYNRWGEPVFEVYNFPPNVAIYGWDGTHRGELSNSAVFVWFAEVEFEDGEVVLFKGDVTLMR